MGLLSRDNVPENRQNPLLIANDVWIGEWVVILPKCKKIGDGAVIGSGSVVTKDIEPFTVVAGVPAREIRKRFPEEIKRVIEATKKNLRIIGN